MVSRVVTGAHYGLRDWLVQRFTAGIMFVFTLILLGFAWRYGGDAAAWRALFDQDWMRYASLLFALSLYWHAWVGMRDILMDYVRTTWVRLPAQVAVIVALLVYAMWTVHILWGGR